MPINEDIKNAPVTGAECIRSVGFSRTFILLQK